MADETINYGDPAALLTEVNKAIAAVMVGGQSYKIGSRSLTRANLTELRNLRQTSPPRWRNRADPPFSVIRSPHFLRGDKAHGMARQNH